MNRPVPMGSTLASGQRRTDTLGGPADLEEAWSRHNGSAVLLEEPREALMGLADCLGHG
jgi:hypothetical protein